MDSAVRSCRGRSHIFHTQRKKIKEELNQILNNRFITCNVLMIVALNPEIRLVEGRQLILCISITDYITAPRVYINTLTVLNL